MKDTNIKYEFETTSTPDRAKDEAIIYNTRKYNSPHVDNDFMPLSVYCTDSAGEILGGLTGKTYWNYLDIEFLWVYEDHRDKDIATKVIAMAEEEVVPMSCWIPMNSALDFYIKQGYECFGKLDDYCKKYKRYYLKKVITIRNNREKV